MLLCLRLMSILFLNIFLKRAYVGIDGEEYGPYC